ncbi:MAG: DUF5908 family protein [Bacteroidota bacterium]
MPIEIRELVIKATVHKQIQSDENKYVTQRELRSLKKEILEAVKASIREDELNSNRRF